MSKNDAKVIKAATAKKEKAKEKADRKKAKKELALLEAQHIGNTLRLSNQLEELTGLESRVTILGHVQRGGTPSAADRLLATHLGTACVHLISQGKFGVMVASRGAGTEAIPLQEVVGKRKTVPLDHPWILCARQLGTNLGD